MHLDTTGSGTRFRHEDRSLQPRISLTRTTAPGKGMKISLGTTETRTLPRPVRWTVKTTVTRKTTWSSSSLKMRMDATEEDEIEII